MSLTLLAPVTEHLPEPIAITPPRLAIGDRIERSGVTYEFTGKATNAKGNGAKTSSAWIPVRPCGSATPSLSS